MKFRRLAVLLISALALQCFLPAALAAEASGENTTTDTTETAEFDGYLLELNVSSPIALFEEEDTLEYVADNIYLTHDLETAQALMESGTAIYMEPNYIVSLIDDDLDSDVASASETGLISDSDDESDDSDTEEDDSDWGYAAICAEYANSRGLDGSGVRIALIDSGVALDNPDLTEANIDEGYDYITDSTEMCDERGHGTRVAQVIVGDDNGQGCTGIARGATIVPLRCFDAEGESSNANLIKAINAAVNKYDCDIISMSWGLKSNTPLMRNAIKEAVEQGVLLVAASGNVNSDYPAGTLVYPAAYDSVISVASVNSSLTVVSTSQQNKGVTVCAPGQSRTFVDADGSLVTASGTSFATPCVTAIVAILLQLAPELTSDDVFSLLSERAYDLGDSGWDQAYGYGFTRLDLILGDGWSRLDTSTETDSDTGTETESQELLGWMLAPSGGSFLLASYNADGQFLQFVPLDAAVTGDFLLTSASLTFDDDVASIALFCVDDNYCPLSACGRWTLDG